MFVLRGLAWQMDRLEALGMPSRAHDGFLREALFSTITNVNWRNDRFEALIDEGMDRRDQLAAIGPRASGPVPEAVTWRGPRETFVEKGRTVGVLMTENEDVRCLRELLLTGVKGIAAYAAHAAVLGREDAAVDAFMAEALASTTRDLSVDDMLGLVMRAGDIAVKAMAVLDDANTSTYGHPEIAQVDLGAGTNPGILVSGHDLKDLKDLLDQTSGTGIDVYTHGEMLPAHAYPEFRKYPHLVGNYGGAWWQQTTEFEVFNGPILLTTNCLVPPRKDTTYLPRLYTTGAVGYPGATHVADGHGGAAKDYSALIAQAKTCAPPKPIETGALTVGFAHNQVLALADKVLEAVSSGAIKRFVVMAGCDGRRKDRAYYTDVAKTLPDDAVILTAGCAKYRYNKLDLGDIGGIPRLLDAGQCNDSYSLVKVALALKEATGAADINDLPISYDIAWYEQKAVAVLLALLSLGVKGIRLGPTLPGFLSPAVTKVLVETFGLRPAGTVEDDVPAMMAGA